MISGLPKFETKHELFTYLKANKERICNIKKQQKKFTDNAINHFEKLEQVQTKSGLTQNEISLGYIDKAIVGNTYNWLDSHGDVHVKGCFQKSISERKTQVLHLHDHELKLTSQVGDIKEIMEVDVEWKTLGVDLDGKTTSLIANTKVQKDYNPMIFKMYNEGKINQHSVGMFYVKVDLAVNSMNSEFLQEKAEWDKVYPLLGNKSDADELGYFFIVKEAKLLEISAVPYGSNILTPAYNEMTDVIAIEPIESLDINEPSNDTQQTEVYNEPQSKEELKDYFIKNFTL